MQNKPTHISLPIEQLELLIGEIRALRKEVSELKVQLKPVIKFHNSTPEPPTLKRLTKKQKEQRELEQHQLILEQKSLFRVKQKGLN